MSRLLILGATGGTGAALIRQALEAGHEVSAFARTPATIPVPHHERLRALRGDIMDAEQVSRAVPGHDAVLSTLGRAAWVRRASIPTASSTSCAR